MRANPDRRFYVLDGAIIHSKSAPPGAREIEAEEAARMKAARPKPVRPVHQQDVAPTPAPVVIAPAADDTTGTLALAVAMAGYAIQAGVQAGDYRWHGGDTDFEWQGVRYDAPGLIEYARSVLG